VSGAALLAAAAAALAAAGIVDLAAALGERRRARPARRPALLELVARVGRRLGAPAPPADLERRIAAAGAPPSLRVADVMAIKAGAALLAFVASLPLAASARWRPRRRRPAASCCPTSG
jgi:tight adherence protein C